MEQNRNIDFDSEVEINCLKDTMWRLTTRVYVLEEFISEQFGQVLGPAGFSKESSPSPCSPPFVLLHKLKPFTKTDTTTTKTVEVIIPSPNVSSRTRGFNKRKTLDVADAVTTPGVKGSKKKMEKNTKRKKISESELDTDLNPNPVNIDVESYDIEDQRESDKNDTPVLVPKEKPYVAVEEQAEDQSDNDMEANFGSDAYESPDASQNEISSIGENDFVVILPKSEVDVYILPENEDTVNIKDEKRTKCTKKDRKCSPRVSSVSRTTRNTTRKSSKKVKEEKCFLISDNSDGGSNISKKIKNKRGESMGWTLEETFENETYAKEKIMSTDWQWRVDFTKVVQGGKRVYYKCHQNCRAKLYLFMSADQNDTEVALFTNNVPHGDHQEEKSRGISKFVKLRIQRLTEEGLQPPDVLKQLQDEKLRVPELQQIRRYLDYCRMKKYGNSRRKSTNNSFDESGGHPEVLQTSVSDVEQESETVMDEIVVYKQ